MLGIAWIPYAYAAVARGKLERRGRRILRRLSHEGLAYWGGFIAGSLAGVADLVADRVHEGFDEGWSDWVDDPAPICRSSSSDSCRTSRGDGLDGPVAQAVDAMRRRSTSTSDSCSERSTRTPCCGVRMAPRGMAPVVMWNEWNGVMQCHNCGRIYLPADEGDETAYDKWADVGGGLIQK